MKKTFLLCRNNIRKEKGQTIAFFFIILIASIFLNLGFITLLNYSDNYDEKFEESNSAHALIAMTNENYNPEYLEFMKNYKNLKDAEERDIKIAAGEYVFSGALLSQKIVFYDYEDSTIISNFKYTDVLEQIPEDAIYLPKIFEAGGGIALGSPFTITIDGLDYTYTVAGFYEDLNTGRYSYSFIGFTLGHKNYEELVTDNKSIFSGKVILGRLNDSINNETLYRDLMSFVSTREDNASDTILSADGLNIKNSSFVTVTIMQMVLIAFALIITAISLIVIKFKISNTLEEEIENIGALKAIGYTSFQLIASYILQFTGIALLGGVIGAGASYTVFPILKAMLASNSGVSWEQGIDAASIVLSISILIAATMAVTVIATRKLKNILPITALRGGIKSHNFKRNVFPLDTSCGNVNFLLAMKTMFQNIYQNITIVIIISAVTFASAFCLVLYQNIAIEYKPFCDLIGAEYSNILLEAGETDLDNNELKEQILENKNVRKVIFYDLFGRGFLENGKSVMVFVAENFDDTENKKCYEGRDCEFDNEIVLNGCLARILNKKIGDTIVISNGAYSYEYIITGLMATGNNKGYECELTLKGYQNINPNYQMKTINVYTKEDSNVNEVIKELKSEFGNTFIKYSNMDEGIISMIQTFRLMAGIMTVSVIMITVLIIILCFNLIVRTLITKQKQDIGIKKALGYTTSKLMLQIALSFVPVALLGTILGAFLGSFGTNPLLSVMLRTLGIMKVNFPIPYLAIIILSIILCIFAFLIAMLVAARIRKISSAELIME